MLTAASAAPKISFDTVAMIFFSAVGLHRRELHDAFLSMMQSLHCMRGAADRGEHRQAARAMKALRRATRNRQSGEGDLRCRMRSELRSEGVGRKP
jgi:hypothetical protein